LPPKAILTRLANRLKLLNGGAKDLPARQRTLRGAIEWSHDLLDEGERTLFARLAVFSGGRTLEAIETVCDAEGDLPMAAFDGVSSLLDKSLLTRDEGPQEEPKFVMLETIHEYAREKLKESGEAEVTKRLHAEYFLSFAEEAEPELVGAEQIEWMDRLEAEHDNFRTALSWSVEAGEVESVLRMAGSLSLFWSVRGYSSEGRGWCEEALARDAAHESPMRAKVLLGLGIMAWRQSDYDGAEQSLGESLALYRGSGDGKGEAISLLYLGKAAIDRNRLDLAAELLSEGESICRSLGYTANLADILNISAIVAMARGDLVGANTILEEGLGLARAAGHIRCLALATSNLGINAMLEGDYEKARALMEEALELNLALKDRGNLAVSLHNLGLIALRRGDPEQAGVLCAQSTQIFGDLLDSIGVTISLDALAAVSGERGEVRKAVRLWGAAQTLRDAMRVSQPPDDKEVLEAFVEAARARLEAATFRAAWEQGRAMTQEQAVALALQDVGNGEHTARAEPA
jgi:tetratricopeptide (TPR) repeat protein